jgi:hypothetical protein
VTLGKAAPPTHRASKGRNRANNRANRPRMGHHKPGRRSPRRALECLKSPQMIVYYHTHTRLSCVLSLLVASQTP